MHEQVKEGPVPVERNKGLHKYDVEMTKLTKCRKNKYGKHPNKYKNNERSRQSSAGGLFTTPHQESSDIRMARALSAAASRARCLCVPFPDAITSPSTAKEFVKVSVIYGQLRTLAVRCPFGFMGWSR
jgi:hypothetical protein